MKTDWPSTWMEVEAYMRKRFQDNFPYERIGQAYFNALKEIYPEVAQLVRGTDADPFYARSIRDPQIRKFFDVIIPYFQ